MDIVIEESAEGGFLIKVAVPTQQSGAEVILASAISDALSLHFPQWNCRVLSVDTESWITAANNGSRNKIITISASRAEASEKTISNDESSELEIIAAEIAIITSKYLHEKSHREKLEQEITNIKARFFDFITENSATIKIAPVYENRAIMFLDLVGFSRLTDEEREDKLDFLRSVAKPLLRNRGASEINMWGDGIVCSFADEMIAVRVAMAFLRHLSVEQTDSRIGVAWGRVRLSYNDGVGRVDYDGAVVNRAARLEPLAEAGEVLLSEEFRGIKFDRQGVVVTERLVSFQKAFDNFKAGDQMQALSVKPVSN